MAISDACQYPKCTLSLALHIVIRETAFIQLLKRCFSSFPAEIVAVRSDCGIVSRDGDSQKLAQFTISSPPFSLSRLSKKTEILRAVNRPHSTKFVSVPEEYLNEYVHDYVGVEKERRCSRIFLLIHMSIYSVTKVKEVNSNLFE